MLASLMSGAVFGEFHGEPPQVLAMHGWARTRLDWNPVLTGLPALAIDLPGFGSSPPPATASSTEEYAELLAPLLQELQPPRILLGHSFGGRVAVRMAARLADQVDHLVLVGTPLFTERRRPPLGRRLVLRAIHSGLLPQGYVERWKHAHGSADYRAAQGVMRDVLVKAVNDDYVDSLRRLTTPTTVILGEHDTAAPPELQRRMLELAAADFRVVPGSGHLLTDGTAPEVRSVLEGLLA